LAQLKTTPGLATPIGNRIQLQASVPESSLQDRTFFKKDAAQNNPSAHMLPVSNPAQMPYALS